MSDCSSSSSVSSLDEEEINTRVYPCWQEYRHLILRRGFRLDTYRDVKEFYERYWQCRRIESLEALKCKEGYVRACNGSRSNEDALCRDAGLVSTRSHFELSE
jgi:sulfatase maturation enzyme AslB (radical SAM superfamily)